MVQSHRYGAPNGMCKLLNFTKFQANQF